MFAEGGWFDCTFALNSGELFKARLAGHFLNKLSASDFGLLRTVDASEAVVFINVGEIAVLTVKEVD